MGGALGVVLGKGARSASVSGLAHAVTSRATMAGINFFIQPIFTHTLFSNEKLDEPLHVKPYRAGIGFGIVRYF